MNVRGLTIAGKWTDFEAKKLEEALAPMPREWIELNPRLRAVHREASDASAPPDAPGHAKYDKGNASIVVFDKGVYDGDRFDWNQFRRSIYHEIAHTLIDNDPSLIQRWIHQTSNDGFVDEYAKTSPEEDVADTFSEFFIHRDKLKKLVPIKFEFINSLLRSKRQMEKESMSNFIHGLSEELTKTAKVGRILKMLAGRSAGAAVRTPGKIGVGKAMLAAGAGTAGGALIGKKKGKRKGYEEGTSDVMSVAERARAIGRREGVMAYHNALLKQQKGGK